MWDSFLVPKITSWKQSWSKCEVPIFKLWTEVKEVRRFALGITTEKTQTLNKPTFLCNSLFPFGKGPEKQSLLGSKAARRKNVTRKTTVCFFIFLTPVEQWSRKFSNSLKCPLVIKNILRLVIYIVSAANVTLHSHYTITSRYPKANKKSNLLTHQLRFLREEI